MSSAATPEIEATAQGDGLGAFLRARWEALKGGDVGIHNAANRSRVHKVAPRRLAHVLLFVTDISRAINFYRDVLGLRLSDRSGDLVAFMQTLTGMPEGDSEPKLPAGQ